MTILLFGSRGNLGSVLESTLAAKGDRVVGGDWRWTLDEAGAAEKKIVTIKPDAIVNAAAFNDVDGAEKLEEELLLTTLNITLPQRLAKLAAQLNIPFIQYSSDYIFDGTQKRPYAEDDEPHPISKYGQSRLAGERAALATEGKVYICRLSKLFGPAGNAPTAKPSFLATMFRLANDRPELSIVDDEVGSPTYTVDVASATFDLLHNYFAPGIYHLVNEGPGVTWYGFAREAFAIAGVTTPCKPVPSSFFPRPARRPHHAPLANTKFPPLRLRQAALQEFLTTTNI